MSYGLKILGTTGLLQIDDGYVLFHAVSQGAVSSGSVVPSGSGLLFVAPHTATGHIARSTNSSSAFSSSSGTYNYVRMDINPTASNSGYGLIVHTSNGITAYDSTKKLMYPVLSYNFNEALSGTYSASKTISVPPVKAGRKRYVAAYPMVSMWANRLNPSSPNIGYQIMLSVTINSSSVTIHAGPVSGGPPDDEGPFGGMNFFFADFLT